MNRLHLDGEWDGALALLDGADSDGKGGSTAAIRARILVDRFWWRLDDPAPAERAVARLLYLRSALDARPQTAAAQATLAHELPPGQERDMLVQAARSAASELSLTWLSKQLAETSQPT